MSDTRAPLHGRRVLVAQAREQADELSGRIRSLGGTPVEAPVLALEPGDGGAMQEAARQLLEGRFSLLALTSATGVDALANALVNALAALSPSHGAAAGGRASAAASADPLARVGTVACVGSGTAGRVEARFGRAPDVVTDRATARALGEAVSPGRGTALLPRADIASPELPRLLAEKGYDTVEVVAYRVARPEALPAGVADEVRSGAIDLIPLTSPSMARNLVSLVGAPEIGGRVVSIGPVTSAACAAIGVEVAVEANRPDLDGLATALHRAVAGQPPIA